MENTLTYSGNPHKLFRLHLKNFFLSILTLGFYRFWGKTHIRNYVVGSFSVNEDPFVYTGTAKELLYGFLKVILFYIIILLFLNLMQFAGLGQVIPTSLVIAGLPLFFLAFLLSLRYRLARIQFKGVAFHLTAPIKMLMGVMLKTFGLNLITLGYLSYKTMPRRYKAIISSISYGTTPFQSEPDAQNLYKINLITLLLAPVTLGFSRIWFHAALNAEMIRTMKLANLSFDASLVGSDVFKLHTTNMFIVLLTLGLGTAYTHHRTYRFYAKRLQVIGDMAAFSSQEITDFSESSGEGMMDILGDTAF